MKVLRAFIGACLLLLIGLVVGGFLGVSGTTGPNSDRDLYLFIDPYGQVQPAVTPETTVHWTKLGGKDGKQIVPVTDIKFIGGAPCNGGDPAKGDCEIDVKDGWHPYECAAGSCADPTLPVGCRTRPGCSSTQISQGDDSAIKRSLPIKERIELAYFRLADRFDGVLHSIWSGDDKPVDPYATPTVVVPPPSSPVVKFPTGPIARETVVCSGGAVTVPPDQTLFTGGASAVVPGVSIIWDGGTNLGSDWTIQDTTGAGQHLSDVCDSPQPPYAAASQTAGLCHLNSSAASASVQYQVVVNSGSCKGSFPATLAVGSAAPVAR